MPSKETGKFDVFNYILLNYAHCIFSHLPSFLFCFLHCLVTPFTRRSFPQLDHWSIILGIVPSRLAAVSRSQPIYSLSHHLSPENL